MQYELLMFILKDFKWLIDLHCDSVNVVHIKSIIYHCLSREMMINYDVISACACRHQKINYLQNALKGSIWNLIFMMLEIFFLLFFEKRFFLLLRFKCLTIHSLSQLVNFICACISKAECECVWLQNCWCVRSRVGHTINKH